MQRRAIVIQARTGSTRLPGKVLLDFSDGKSLLDIMLTNITRSFPDEKVIVATSTNTSDDAIELVARQWDVSCFRGSEDNVVERFVETADRFGVDEIIRVCSDNPFFNMDGLRMLMEAPTNNIDYCSFALPNGTPIIKSHLGLYGEWVKVDALQKVAKTTEESIYLEHVTNYIYTHPDDFQCQWLQLPLAHDSPEKLRFTLDDQDDFSLHQRMYNALGDDAQDVVKLLTFVEEHDLTTIMEMQIDKYTK